MPFPSSITTFLTRGSPPRDSHEHILFADQLTEELPRLESSIRNALAENNHDRIAKIVHQLCHDYAYAVHQPHARNGGLIGLAAAAIALGAEVARYLRAIVPPVLACFSDQDARVRYYACESMYNIAKVAKGEILVYFNDVFDALCKLAADTELSVKNGAELLDRLVKDIVSESAATYASILITNEEVVGSENGEREEGAGNGEVQTAFSLPRFIPLLQERIHVLNPFTRTFLVSWITLLDSIPDLELVAYLPSFLGGLLRFLSDPNQDVHTTTKVALDRFLTEIKKISAVKKGIAESRRSKELIRKASNGTQSSDVVLDSPRSATAQGDVTQEQQQQAEEKPTLTTLHDVAPAHRDNAIDEAQSESSLSAGDDEDEKNGTAGFEDEWIPGQDVQIDYQRILDILVTFLSESNEEEIQVTTLKWIESFLDICPEDILVFTPRLLAQVLPALSHDVDLVKQAASRVNTALMSYIMSLPEEPAKTNTTTELPQQNPPASTQQPGASAPTIPALRALRETNGADRQSTTSLPSRIQQPRKPTSPEPISPSMRTPSVKTPEPPPLEETTSEVIAAHTDLDYEAAVNALTLQFLHEHEATRVAALAWLIMLHRKSPRRILAIQDATFPALLKTLSDPAEAVVTRDLLLLSQISKSSDDSYFSSFMVNLLKLFATDRRLLETRGNLIIRQLCLSLSAEKIYRTMADCLEREEGSDIDFASIMVQNLNNNLITAPELADLRKRLRNLDSRDGQTFFTVLFKAWCVNAVATFSLCLLAQAYEQAYHLLQIFAEMEMTVNVLIQIDKLVQLLESPVFTYLRMQLLEPERFPHLYKCLYGLLMLLPQSSAFAALKNRLNSVSAIGYLHIAPSLRGGGAAGGGVGAGSGATGSAVSTFERQNRLKSREDGGIKWAELLEKFKATQERVRRAQQRQLGGAQAEEEESSPRVEKAGVRGERPQSALSFASTGRPSQGGGVGQGKEEGKGHLRQKSSGLRSRFSKKG
ncbi:uncharacterized protein LTR77_006245 [Saxophila tyrrhenica]|uniref:Vacuolar protein 14 C-terminal Fig4-binding domain-containing protein n=1 Tax=Saxophila tyrrhenica TaxID=1690608 RepID=A0AAV9P9G8_9PEZI|nr:hypothetical protein LTR77_006245 [Saxophila tyrrhenica]